MKYKDQPLGNPESRRVRRTMLHQPRVEVLTRHVEELRDKTGWGRDIPYFDPLDGGVDTQVLFLFESPGDGALASGFVSRDNKDPSAAKFTALNGVRVSSEQDCPLEQRFAGVEVRELRLVGLRGVAQRAHTASGHRIVQREVVATEYPHVVPH